MITPIGVILSRGRREIYYSNKDRVSFALFISSGLVLVLFVFSIFLVPKIVEQRVVRIDLPMPEKHLIPEPKLEPPPMREVPLNQMAVKTVIDQPSVAALPQAQLPTIRTRRDLPTDAGKEGRKRAEEATAQLAAATSTLDERLGDLSTALKNSTAEYSSPIRARRRGVSSGRSSGEIGAVGSGTAGSGSADLGSAVEGSMVAIGSLAAPRGAASGEGSDAARSAGTGPGVYRSNSSLLAVIQKYAAGIQYCYSNELKHDPTLRGKLVVVITVSAAGQVTEAEVLYNSVGSPKLSACAVSQIRDWRFPVIPEGVTTFQAPFVFTPPN